MALIPAFIAVVLIVGGAAMIAFFPGRAKVIGLVPFIIGIASAVL